MEREIHDQHTRKRRLFQLLLEIPKGRVSTYGALARRLGTSPRAVASMLASNREPDRYPCYKVVRADGSVGGYNLGTDEKIRRLSADGLVLDGGGKVPEGSIYGFETDSSRSREGSRDS